MGAKLAKAFESGSGPQPLSAFRKHKLTHDYHTFFDLNKDGVLEWKDFETARTHICQLSKWKACDERYDRTQKLFIKIWEALSTIADKNFDGKISEEEWVEMWETYNRKMYEEQEKAKAEKRQPENVLPKWLDMYVEYKFSLYDRTGDGKIDIEEFEYVLGDFGVKKQEARTAFTMFSQNNERVIDFPTFRKLCEEYYTSDDPNALGNFITGKLDFKVDEDGDDEKGKKK
ncbi:calexcitin-2-like isoform X2 [Tubulanus polymorphus]|uniref:calexcitin-2-like isoform X2 n=1 Tax=Tubulanus polymorphus TaxID=672921 RepID=UPI003DA3E6DA